jgi:NAD(P)-dependent dehydrogenase (short-subunit alcohol dehydrogenase family)
MAYAESKLAVMLFVQELASRGIRAHATDPGATDTDIAMDSSGIVGWLARHDSPSFFVHTPAHGARASIQAVTTELPSGTYLAPRFNQLGKPKVTKLREKARDPAMARALWELSAELTGCDWQRN